MVVAVAIVRRRRRRRRRKQSCVLQPAFGALVKDDVEACVGGVADGGGAGAGEEASETFGAEDGLGGGEEGGVGVQAGFVADF